MQDQHLATTMMVIVSGKELQWKLKLEDVKFDKKEDIYTASKNLHMILLRYKVKIVTLQWRNLSDANVTKRSSGTVAGKTDKTSTLIGCTKYTTL